MKIILGADSLDVSKHAKRTLAAIKKREEQRGDAVPLGVAYHLTRYPHICDDCAQTFWSQDPHYPSHVGCRGGKGKTGF